ncbi:type II secretion system F family protein [uncultured Adlercreutzia sp.]|uniref:type II secretion system F family protein n=1 Tax=uncultured Adlercreutzia sp. TaxID=875803 RepID=UPI002676AE4F|nr:type II secretion system F family protein [uncultured Adlercreutzia sp.]
MGWLNMALVGAAMVLAGAAGWLSQRAAGAWRRRMRHRRAVCGRDGPTSSGAGAERHSALDERLIAYGVGVSRKLHSSLARRWAPAWLAKRPWVAARASTAGLGGRLDDGGFWEARLRLAAGGGAAGLLVGAVFSTELGCCLAVLGAALGWRALPWAIAQRTRRRAEAMERDLSEMLDVVALGMRSGMSFDRSLELYTGYFRTMLAESFARAQRQWTCGLASRDEALRAVAASYASPLLERVVENVIRSLRFGATLADNLEDAAREARSGYKARKQEQVAKAPVKMMVPTGVLILPAMLMLVLGPVLLELAGGL